MRLLVVAGLSVLALAACSRESKTDDTPPPGADPAMTLGGVDLAKPVRALGTEPFWGVTITSEGLLYEGVDRPEQRAENPGPQIAGTTATWTTTTDQQLPLVVTVTDTDCSDGMSDRTYPLTARVQIGEETLMGCAAPVEFLTTTNEQGEPKTDAAAPAAATAPAPAPATTEKAE